MPPVKKTTGPSGPRSKKGKARSSLNAISHGLTSTRVMPDEVQMVQDFTRDLTGYYKPESPLEVLQIQRIALCRARLARLADMELAGREVARHLIGIQPERVMAQLKQYPESIKIVALKSIKGPSMLHALGLDEPTLQAIDREVRELVQFIGSPEDLPLCLPHLSAFLCGPNFSATVAQDAGLDHRLMVFAQRIRDLFEPDLKLEEKGGFEQLLRRVKTHLDLGNQAHKDKIRQHRPGPDGYHESVLKDLYEIRDLVDVQSQVDTVLRSFEEMKSWMCRSVDLQSDESDRLMRYQQMLERRLSTAMGEFLELQKHRKY